MKELKPHPLAAKWPRRTQEEKAALRASIASEGQKRPIMVHAGLIIDGIEREEACRLLGKTVKTEPYKGDTSDAGILREIIAYNGGRNLEKSQRAMLAAEALPQFEMIVAERTREIKRAAALKQHGCKPAQAPESLGEAREIVAKLFAVGPGLVSACKLILKSDPDLAAEVKRGEKNIAKASREVRRNLKTREWTKAAASTTLDMNDCKIIVGDCRKKLEQIPRRKVNLIVTDPPYNIGEKYHGYRDDLPEDEFLGRIQATINLFPDLLADDGSVFVMMSSRYSDQIGMFLRCAGLHRQDAIVWAESFGSHNSEFWTDCYRVIHHYTKHQSSFTFHADDERIYIPSWRKLNGDSRQVTAGKLPPNVWGVWTDTKLARIVDNSPERIPDKIAPNQLPVKLIERIILAASNPGDLVLDPFHGTGTTARACLKNGRKYAGIEIDPKIAERSKIWIKASLAKSGGGNA